MWPYQQERQQIYKFDWDRDNHTHLREYRRQYRADHPEETRKQRLKDWKSFVERHPERWKEINENAKKKYQAKRKAEREALRKEKV